MDLFNAFTLALFKELYDSFPSPIDVDATEIAWKLLPELSQEDGLRLFRAADHAVNWLVAEGFIRVGSTSMDAASEFSDVSLSSRGLAVLGSVPDAIEKKESVATQIEDLLAEAGKDVAKEEVRTGIRTLMLYIIKAGAAWAAS